MLNKIILTIIAGFLLSSCSVFPSFYNDPLNNYSTPATVMFLAQKSADSRAGTKVETTEQLNKYKNFCGVDGTIDQLDLFATIKAEAIQRNTGLSATQMQQVTRLLASGSFISDINSVLDVALKNIVDLVVLDNPQKIPRRTLSDLLGNETLRFAVIVYAHSHGIDINEDDLKSVKQTLDSGYLDLTSLIDQGKQRIKEKYGLEKLNSITSGCGA